MTSETHHLFDSIFNNTHSELLTLQNKIEELQIIYQSNNVIILSINDESPLIEVLIEYNKSVLNEFILNESILNDKQINKFKNIYLKNKIDDVKNDNDDSIQKLKENLNKNDNEA